GDILTIEYLVVVSTAATAAWTTTAGVKVTAANVAAASGADTTNFTGSNPTAGSSADAVTRSWSRRWNGTLRLEVAIRKHTRIWWNQQRISNDRCSYWQRRVLNLRRIRIRCHDLR